jgi:undecaprenyl-diphosphatase
VSSTGHLILVGHALNFTGEEAVSFKIAIQLGAILSVMVYYRRRLWRLVRNPVDLRLPLAIGIAFAPAAVLGLALHKWIEAYLFGPTTVAWALVFGGVVILIVEHNLGKRQTAGLDHIELRQAWWVGIAQCFSLFPGVSRSGSTITTGRALKFSREAAAVFSFLMSAPITFAATVLKVPEAIGDSGITAALVVGVVASAISGWLAITVLLKLVARRGYGIFAAYRVLLGAAILALAFSRAS